jgi:hypothetical protein
MVTGSRFRDGMFAFTLHQLFVDRLPLLGTFLWHEFLFALPLLVLGAIYFAERKLEWLFVIYFLSNSLWALNYNVIDVFVFFIPSFMVLTVFAAVGLDCFAKWRPCRRVHAHILLSLCIPMSLLLINWRKVDQSDNVSAKRAIESILRAVDSRAILVSPGYHWSEYFWYYLIGEGLGDRDVFVMHHFSPADIKAYLEDQVSFRLPEQRREVPLGLDVYCFTDGHAEVLAQAGLVPERWRGDIFRIRAP